MTEVAIPSKVWRGGGDPVGITLNIGIIPEAMCFDGCGGDSQGRVWRRQDLTVLR